MRADLAFASLLGASILVTSTAARSYCRTTTVSSPALDANGCPAEGRTIFWKSACVGYHMTEAASRQLSLEQASRIAARAFSEWTIPNSACVPSIGVVALAPTAESQVGYVMNGPNENIIVFRDDGWDHPFSSSTLELATVTFRPSTGEILDADIEINTHDNTFVFDPTVDAGDDTSFDLRFVMTHAVGHFLGFAHSSDPTSVMWPFGSPGLKTPPFVTPDDALGICSTYRESGVRTTTDAAGEPVEVDPSVCNLSPVIPAQCAPLDVHHGCSIALARARRRDTGAPTNASTFASGALLFALCAWLRRLNPQPEPPGRRKRR
jgi:hypothetical protein